MNILSIQSGVIYGHVGNGAAVFALQRLGHEVWPIDTVRFSNHPGHGAVRGGATAPAEMAELIGGLADHGWLGTAGAVLTGYLGQADQGPVVLEAVARVRDANPDALWALDPVIGDHGRVFVKPGIPAFLRDQAAPHADILTPNAFELSLLTARSCDRLAEAVAAAHDLRIAGGRADRIVAVTALAPADGAPGMLVNLAIGPAGAWRVTTPRIEHPANGAGDLFAALLLGNYLANRDLRGALAAATASVHAVIARSAAARSRELVLIGAQDELVRPSILFAPEPLAA